VTKLNLYHGTFFWISLFTVGFADFYIWMVGDPVITIKFFHFNKRLVGSHNDLYIFKFIYFGEYVLYLVFTMIAGRTEKHDNCTPVFFDIVLSKPGYAVYFKQFERWNRREPEISWLTGIIRLCTEALNIDCYYHQQEPFFHGHFFQK